MSDGATAGIDPRFDPRYQRGYSGESAVDREGAVDAAPPARPSVVRVPDPPKSITAAPVVVGQIVDVETNDDVDVLEQSFQRSDPQPQDGAIGDRVRPWLIGAWSVLGASLLIGTSMIWSLNNDPKYYMGMGDVNGLREITWVVAPALVRVALVSTVALIVAMGVRRAWPDPVPPERERPPVTRTPAFVALLTVIIGAAIIVAWYATIAGATRLVAVSGPPEGDQVMLMALQATVSTVSNAIVEAAVWAVLGILVLGAVSAERARSARPDRP
ncbi:hypothetical protein [Agromyces subbeticus]|uniref:hypothetical protein n=1 Tax=Agromyces subbeticus TaxID=293890 RepID=UPI0003B3C596|nr:hypothetical protein [Agromyces subbeticus]